jgi:hypothetical protein
MLPLNHYDRYATVITIELDPVFLHGDRIPATQRFKPGGAACDSA